MGSVSEKPIMRKWGKQWYCQRRRSFIFGCGRTMELAYEQWKMLNRDETLVQEVDRILWGGQ